MNDVWWKSGKREDSKKFVERKTKESNEKIEALFKELEEKGVYKRTHKKT